MNLDPRTAISTSRRIPSRHSWSTFLPNWGRNAFWSRKVHIILSNFYGILWKPQLYYVIAISRNLLNFHTYKRSSFNAVFLYRGILSNEVFFESQYRIILLSNEVFSWSKVKRRKKNPIFFRFKISFISGQVKGVVPVSP